jgi:hypothetical protein
MSSPLTLRGNDKNVTRMAINFPIPLPARTFSRNGTPNPNPPNHVAMQQNICADERPDSLSGHAPKSRGALIESPSRSPIADSEDLAENSYPLQPRRPANVRMVHALLLG